MRWSQLCLVLATVWWGALFHSRAELATPQDVASSAMLDVDDHIRLAREQGCSCAGAPSCPCYVTPAYYPAKGAPSKNKITIVSNPPFLAHKPPASTTATNASKGAAKVAQKPAKHPVAGDKPQKKTEEKKSAAAKQKDSKPAAKPTAKPPKLAPKAPSVKEFYDKVMKYHQKDVAVQNEKAQKALEKHYEKIRKSEHATKRADLAARKARFERHRKMSKKEDRTKSHEEKRKNSKLAKDMLASHEKSRKDSAKVERRAKKQREIAEKVSKAHRRKLEAARKDEKQKREKRSKRKRNRLEKHAKGQRGKREHSAKAGLKKVERARKKKEKKRKSVEAVGKRAHSRKLERQGKKSVKHVKELGVKEKVHKKHQREHVKKQMAHVAEKEKKAHSEKHKKALEKKQKLIAKHDQHLLSHQEKLSKDMLKKQQQALKERVLKTTHRAQEKGGKHNKEILSKQKSREKMHKSGWLKTAEGKLQLRRRRIAERAAKKLGKVTAEKHQKDRKMHHHVHDEKKAKRRWKAQQEGKKKSVIKENHWKNERAQKRLKLEARTKNEAGRKHSGAAHEELRRKAEGVRKRKKERAYKSSSWFRKKQEKSRKEAKLKKELKAKEHYKKQALRIRSHDQAADLAEKTRKAKSKGNLRAAYAETMRKKTTERHRKYLIHQHRLSVKEKSTKKERHNRWLMRSRKEGALKERHRKRVRKRKAAADRMERHTKERKRKRKREAAAKLLKKHRNEVGRKRKEKKAKRIAAAKKEANSKKKHREAHMKFIKGSRAAHIKKWNFRPRPGKIIASPSKIKNWHHYTYTFWVRPEGTRARWTELMHKGFSDGDRDPGFLFRPGSTRLSIVSGTRKKHMFHISPKKALPMWKWTHVSFLHQKGKIEVFFNGNRIIHQTGPKIHAPRMNKGPLYACTTYHKPALASISDLIYWPILVPVDKLLGAYKAHHYKRFVPSTVTLRRKDFKIQRGFMAAPSKKIKMAGKFSYMFWINPTALHYTWTNILHKGSKNWDRSPAVYFMPKTSKLRIYSGDSRNAKSFVNVHSPLKLYKWTHVAILHAEGKFQVYLNNRLAVTAKKAYMPLENRGNLYASGRFHKHAHATVADLRYTRGLLTLDQIQWAFKEKFFTKVYVPDVVVQKYNLQPRKGHIMAKAKTVRNTGRFSYMLWVKPEGTRSKDSGLMWKGSLLSRSPSLEFIKETTRLRIRSSVKGNDNYGFDMVSSLPMHQWTHITIVHTHRRLELYVNGKSKKIVKHIHGPLQNKEHLYAVPKFSVPAFASLSDVRYYPRAATKHEIKLAVLHKRYFKHKAWQRILRRNNFQPRKGFAMAQAKSLREPSNGQYSYMFWIRPYYIVHKKVNLLHKGASKTQYGPAIYFLPGSTRLAIYQQDRKKWNRRWLVPRALKLYKWTHFAFARRAGHVKIWLDGKLVLKQSALRPLRNMGPLYISDKWDHKPFVFMSDVRYISGFISQARVSKAVTMARYQKIKALPLLVMAKTFRPVSGLRVAFDKQLKNWGQFGYMFWIKIEGTRHHLGTILHKGKQTKAARDEAPAILLAKGSTKLEIRSANSKGQRVTLHTPALSQYTWTHIAVTHKHGDLSVYVNTKRVARRVVTGPLINHAPLYCGNKKYKVALVKLADLRYFSEVPTHYQLMQAWRGRRYRKDAKINSVLKRGPFTAAKGHIVATDRQIRNNRAYSYMFWIKVFYSTKGITNVMQKGRHKHDYGPAIFLRPYSSRLFFRVSSKKNMKDVIQPKKSFSFYKWHHVAVSIRSGLWQVWYDSKVIYKRTGSSAAMPVENKGPLYAGSEFWNRAHVDLADIHHVSGPLTQTDVNKAYRGKKFVDKKPHVVVAIGSNFLPKKGRKVAAASLIKKRGRYTYMFWVRPEGTHAYWSNVFFKGHRTTHQGPAVFVHPESTRLRIRSSIHGNWKYAVSPSAQLPVWKWTHVTIVHQKGTFQVRYNTKLVANIKNAPIPSMNYGPLYVSHKMWPSAVVTVSDLRMYAYTVTMDQVTKAFKKRQFVRHKVISTVFEKRTIKVRKGKLIAKGSLIPRSGQQSYTFWIRPHELAKGWSNIIHKGKTAKQREPSLWFWPRSSRLRIYSATRKNRKWHYDPKLHLSLYKWTHVAIAHRSGTFRVWFNGKLAAHVKLTQPHQGTGNLYAGSPWAPAAHARISDIRYVDGFLSYLGVKKAMAAKRFVSPKLVGKRLVKKNFQPIKGRIVASATHVSTPWDGQYSLSFWLKVTGTQKGWSGLLLKGRTHKERGPGIWLWPKHTRLHIRSASWKYWNHGLDPARHMVLHRWTHVTLTHREKRMVVYVDGKVAGIQKWTAGPQRNFGSIYASDKYHRAAWATMSDLRWWPRAIQRKEVLKVFKGRSFTKLKRVHKTLLAGNKLIRKGLLIARGNQIHRLGRFTYFMWVRLFYTQKHWSSLLHKGQGANKRAPAIFVYPKSTRLHIRSATRRHWNDGHDPSQHLKLYTWTHVAVAHRAGTFKVWYNGKVVLKKFLHRPKENAGHLYAGSPVYTPAYGYIADVRLSNVLATTQEVIKVMNLRKYGKIVPPNMKILRATNYRPRRHYIVANGKQLKNRGRFSYAFWIKPEGDHRSWTSILHHGYKNHERNPALFFAPKTTQLVIVSGVWGSWNYQPPRFTKLQFHHWTHVAISHQKGQIKVYYNGKLRTSAKAGLPLMNPHALYSGDKFYAPALCSISDLRYYPYIVSAKSVSRAFARRRFKKDVKVTFRIKKDNFRLKRGMKVARDAQIRRNGGQFSYMFWIRPFSVSTSWTNIIHKGRINTNRMPAVFLYPRSTRLHVRSGTWDAWNNGQDPAQHLALYRWSHVALAHRAGSLLVWINGKVVVSKKNIRRPLELAGPLYASDPWHPAGLAYVSDLRHISGFITTAEVRAVSHKHIFHKLNLKPFFIRRSNFRPRRRQKLASASQFVNAGRYSYTFWIRPEGVTNGWASVIHKGSTNKERAPALFFNPKTTKLTVVSGTAQNYNYYITISRRLHQWQWTHVALSHQFGQFNIYFNGLRVGGRVSHSLFGPNENRGPLYSGDPWYASAYATMSDLRYHPYLLSGTALAKIVKQRKFKNTMFKSIMLRSGKTLAVTKGQKIRKSIAAKSGAYGMMFWIKPLSMSPGRVNIVHRGRSGAEMAPSFKFAPYSSKLVVYSGSVAKWNEHLSCKRCVLPLYRWSHVAMSHAGTMLKIWVNGRVVARKRTRRPAKARHNLPVYASSPFEKNAIADVGDVQFVTGPVNNHRVLKVMKAKRYHNRKIASVLLRKYNLTPRKGFRLAHSRKIVFNGHWTYMFWIHPTGWSHTWSNYLFHGNGARSRSPAVFMTPHYPRLRIYSSTHHRWHNYVQPSVKLQLFKWTHVTIMHRHKHMAVYYNGVRVKFNKNVHGPKRMNGVLYAGAPWYRVGMGQLSDVRYYAGFITKRVRSLAIALKRFHAHHRYHYYARRKSFHIRRNMIIGTKHRFRREGQYSYAFWVRIYAQKASFSNLLNKYHCTPCVYVRPKSTRLYIVMRHHRGKKTIVNTPSLPLYRWTHVALSNRFAKQRVWINGRVVFKGATGARPVEAHSPLYSTFNYNPASAFMAKVHYFAGFLEQKDVTKLFHKKQVGYKKASRVTLYAGTFRGYRGKKIASAKRFKWRGRYSFSFWLKPEGAQKRWRNILHRGRSMRTRKPAIWFYPGTTRLVFQLSNWYSNSWGFTMPRALTPQKWVHITFTDTYNQVQVFINGVRKMSRHPPSRGKMPIWERAALYASSPWAEVAAFRMADVRYYPYIVSPTLARKLAAKVTYKKEQKMIFTIRSWNYMPRRGMKVATNNKIRRNYKFSYTMWLLPFGESLSWRNIMFKGGHGTARNPAMWFYPRSTRLHIRSGTMRGWNSGCDPTQRLALYKWSHVAFSHQANIMRVWINGKVVRSCKLPMPIENKGPMYSSMGTPAKVWISDFKHINMLLTNKDVHTIMHKKRYKKWQPKMMTIRKWNFRPHGNMILARKNSIPGTGRYQIMFWVRLEGKRRGWTNLFKKGNHYTHRRPAVWVYPRSTRLHIRSSMANSWNYGGDPNYYLPLNVWTHVSFAHKKGMFRAWINGKLYINQRPTYGPKQDNAPMYAGRGTKAPYATISDLRYYPYIASTKVLHAAVKARRFRADKIYKTIFMSANFKARKGYRVGLAKKIRNRGQFHYMFWLQPFYTDGSGWDSVLHKGRHRNDRGPAVFFHKRSSRLYFYINTRLGMRTYAPSQQLALGRWTHVSFGARAGSLRIWYNGRMVMARFINRPKGNSGHLYAGAPWYHAAYAIMSDLRHYSSLLGTKSVIKVRNLRKRKEVKHPLVVLAATNFYPRKGRIKAAAPQIHNHGQYTWMMWIKPKGRQTGWSNIIHKGRVNTQRNPAVFMFPRSTRLHVVTGTYGSWNYNINPVQQLAIGKWTHFVLQHRHNLIRIYYNGKLVGHRSRVPSHPLSNNGPLYTCDPWHLPALVVVSDLRYYPVFTSYSTIRKAVTLRRFKKEVAVLTTLRAWNLAPRRRYVPISNAQIKKALSYSYFFWIRPYYVYHGWNNVFHKGASNSQRSPAVWMYPRSSRLHIRSGTKLSYNWGWDPPQHLKLYKWTHVAFSHGNGRFKVWYNAKLVVNRKAWAPIENNGNLYISDPWYQASYCHISDLKHLSGPTNQGQVTKIFAQRRYRKIVYKTLVIKKSNFRPVRRKIIAYHSQLPNTGAYSYMFWLRPEGTSAPWSNIFHKGNSNTQRNPAVWFYPGSTRLHIRSGVYGSWNYGLDPGQHLNAWAWTHVAILSKHKRMEVYYNGRLVAAGNNINRGPSIHHSNLYGSDPWYVAAKASLSDLRYTPRFVSRGEIRARVKAKKFVRKAHLMKLLVRSNRKLRRNSVCALSASIPKSYGQFAYMFWIRPYSIYGYWSNIIHKGSTNHQRNPAVWFYPGSTRLHVRVGTRRSWSDGYDPGQHLKLYQWTHVAFTVREGSMKIWYNSKLVASRHMYAPKETKSHLYCGDPWYHSSAAHISDLRYVSGYLSTKNVHKIHRLKRYKKIKFKLTTLRAANFNIRKGFRLSGAYHFKDTGSLSYTFWVRPHGVQTGWASILHRGRVNTHRMPAFWFYPRSTRLHIRSSSYGSWNYGFDPSQKLVLNKWTHVAFVHRRHYMATYLNSKLVIYRTHGVRTPTYARGPLYASDPWHHPAMATIADVRYLPATLPPHRIKAIFKKRKFSKLKKYVFTIRKWNFKPRRNYRIASTNQIRRSHAYSWSMWIMPRHVQNAWSNIIHKGRSNTIRAPAIWFYPSSTRLHIRSSTRRAWNQGMDPGRHLPLYKWTHVAFAHGSRNMRVWYNGVQVARSTTIWKPRAYAPGPLYASDPWHVAAGCVVSDLKHFNYAITGSKARSVRRKRYYKKIVSRMVIIKARNSKPKKGHRLHPAGMVPTGRYSYMMWLRPEGTTSSWSNIFHRGHKNTIRAPAMWFWPGTTRLHLISGTIKAWNAGWNDNKNLPLYKWTHLAFTHRHGRFKVYKNGVLVYNKWQWQPVMTNDAIYFSDPWHQVAHVTLSDWRYYPRITLHNEVRAAYKGVKFTRGLPRKTYVVQPWNKRVKRHRVLAYHRSLPFKGSYTYSFWIKPLSIIGSWANILHKGRVNTQRNPAFWFYPGSTRLHVRSGTRTGWNNGRDPGDKLPLYRWTHVALSHRAGRMMLWYNGRLKVNVWARRPLGNNGPLYSGDPWHHAAVAYISDVRYITSHSTTKQIHAIKALKRYRLISPQAFVIRRKQFPLRRGMVVARASALKFSGQYTYMFWVRPYRVYGAWTNIIHHGRLNHHRAPAVWFYPRSLRLHIRSSTKTHWNTGYDPHKQLPIHAWTHVAISHAQGRLAIYYNGKLIRALSKHPPTDFGGNLYASDPWHHAAFARVADLRYYSRVQSHATIKKAYQLNAKKYAVLVVARGWRKYHTNNYGHPRVYRYGRLCFLSGVVKGPAGVIVVVPPACRPRGGRLIFSVIKSARQIRVDLVRAGSVYVITGGFNGWLSLNSLVWDPWTPRTGAVTAHYGWRNYGYGYQGLGLTRYGATCLLSGLLRAGRWGYTVHTKYCNPSGGRIIFGVNNHQRQTRMDILTNGWVLRSGGTTNHGWVSLSGMLWTPYPGIRMSLYKPWRNYRAGYRHAHLRTFRSGSTTVCILTGLIKNTQKKWRSHITTLPKGCRPKRRQIFHTFSPGPKPYWLEVHRDGRLLYIAGRTNVRLRSVRYCASRYRHWYRVGKLKRYYHTWRGRYWNSRARRTVHWKKVRSHRVKTKHKTHYWTHKYFYYNKKYCKNVYLRYRRRWRRSCWWRRVRGVVRYLHHRHYHTYHWAYKRVRYVRWHGAWRWKWYGQWRNKWVYHRKYRWKCRVYRTRHIYRGIQWLPLDGIHFKAD